MWKSCYHMEKNKEIQNNGTNKNLRQKENLRQRKSEHFPLSNLPATKFCFKEQVLTSICIKYNARHRGGLNEAINMGKNNYNL